MARYIALMALVLAGCHNTPHAPPKQHLAITNATIYPAPGVAPIQHGVVVIRGELITAIGVDNDVRVPGDAAVIDAEGQFVVAGFWLTSVDLARFSAADAREALQPAIIETFLKRGYTTVIDSSTNSDSAVALRERIAAHELEGPSILTAKDVAGIESTPPDTDPESSLEAKLAYLTTWPAKRYDDVKRKLENRQALIDEHHRDNARSGTLTDGARADIVILGSDPGKSMSAFADVRSTITKGRVSYQRQ